MGSIVTIKDTGFDALLAGVAYLADHAVDVGMMENHDRAGEYGDPMRQSLNDDGSINNDMTIAEVFADHELGMGVPKRSSLGYVVDNEEGEINRGVFKAVNAMIGKDGISGRKVLDEVADVVIELVHERIESNIAPKLSPDRMEEKRAHGKPAEPALIMHGRMIDSFTSKQVMQRG